MDAAKAKPHYIGMMSGTSMDGVDLALVEFSSQSQFDVLGTLYVPYPSELRANVAYTSQHNQDLRKNQDSPLHTELASFYAQSVHQFLQQEQLVRESITALGNHGQTVKHEPAAVPPYSLQLGDGQQIAELTGIRTITQFRQADLAAGGQGAPLMPAFHKAVFGDQNDSFVVNIGGIANITRLDAPVIGFDSGPGNCLMDQWIEKHQQQRFDDAGNWAASGTVHEELLATLLQDTYFSETAPKSTGTDYFNLAWLESLVPNLHELAPEDVQRSLVQFTARSIAQDIRALSAFGHVYVCGGGAQNPVLMHALATELAGFSVTKTDDLGIKSDWLEAIGFAWLAYCYDNDLVSNLPSVTGANKDCILGESFSPNS